MNDWEKPSLEYIDEQARNGDVATLQPTLYHPEIYTGSGIDAMSILLQMYSRPNPQVHTGPVDNDCPLILCDLTLPDTPIIYASEAFTLLTGYTYPEIRGRNCRFLQSPPKAKASFKRSSEDRAALKQIRQAVRDNRECQVQVVNYRKNGTKFLNYLTIIPVRWNSNEFNYSVGLQQGVAELG